MRKLTIRILTALLVLAGLTLVLPAQAGTLYKWTAADGTVSFSDDPDRIPARYRSQAVKQTTKSLETFERFTPTDPAAQADYRKALALRLERLRALNGYGGIAEGYAPAAPAVAAAEAAPFEAVVAVGNKTAIRVPTTPGSSNGPLIVEEVRVRRPGQVTTVHNTVVRQGDDIVMVVRPQNTHESSPSDITDERRLLGGR
jgi:hypothetical protein